MVGYYFYKMYQWEILSEDFSDNAWRCSGIDMINKPIESISIKRNEDLSLSLVANIDDKRLVHTHRRQVGKITSDFENVKFHDDILGDGRAKAIHISKNYITHDRYGNLINTAEISVSEVEVYKSNSQIFQTIEWITNLRSEANWLWPDAVRISLDGKFIREYVSDSGSISIEKEEKLDRRMSVSCLKFDLHDETLIVGETKTDAIDSKYCPGFILYQGSPSEEKMEQVRLSLSFIFGRYLPSLSYSCFDKKWDIVSYKCLIPTDLDQRVYGMSTKPPVKLKKYPGYSISAQFTSDVVESFLLNFYAYDLKYVSSLYWHALSSPGHIKASQLGAAIESLQRNFIKANGQLFEHTLLNSKKWKIIRKKFIKIANEVLSDDFESESESQKKIFMNKINDLIQTYSAEQN